MAISQAVTGMLFSWLFWVVLVVLIFGFSFGALILRKKKKYNFPAIIMIDTGNGKMGIQRTKAGWFKSDKALFGLLDMSGERRLEIPDGRIVQQGSSEDFHEIDFKRGLVLCAKSDDPKILVPLKRLGIVNKELLGAIAPADYRDASTKIVQEATKETQAGWEKIAQIVTFLLLGIIMMICIILVIQYAKNSLTEANKLVEEAMNHKAEIYNSINVQQSSATPSTAP